MSDGMSEVGRGTYWSDRGRPVRIKNGGGASMSDTREKPDNWPIGGLLDAMREVAREEIAEEQVALERRVAALEARLDGATLVINAHNEALLALERRQAQRGEGQELTDAELAPAPEPPVRPDPFSDYPCMPEPIMDDPAPEPSEEALLREWWLVLAGDGDVLEVFAWEDEARQWAREQDAATPDCPPHCVVRVMSGVDAASVQPAPAPRTQRMDILDEIDKTYPTIRELEELIVGIRAGKRGDHSEPCPICGMYMAGESATEAPAPAPRARSDHTEFGYSELRVKAVPVRVCMACGKHTRTDPCDVCGASDKETPAPEPSEEAVKVCVYCHAPITGQEVFSLDADGWVHEKVETCIAQLERKAGERMVRRFAAWKGQQDRAPIFWQEEAERFLKEGAE